jgi:hypothetical protein
MKFTGIVLDLGRYRCSGRCDALSLGAALPVSQPLKHRVIKREVIIAFARTTESSIEIRIPEIMPIRSDD